MIEAREMEKETSTGRLRVAVIGPEKNGKSVLISTCPGITLYLDFDQRAEALAGKKGIYALTLRDPQYLKMPVKLAKRCWIFLTALEQSLDLSKLKDKTGRILFPNVKPETIINNLAFDSMSSFAEAVMYYETYNNKDLSRAVKIGPNLEVRFAKNYDAWEGEKKAVQSMVMRAFALPLSVFCVFHEVSEEADTSTNEKPQYTGRVCIYPVRYRVLLKYFNEVWRVKLTAVPTTTGQVYLPRVYPLPDYSMDAATTMLLDKVEEPNISAMIEKHKTKLGQVKK